LREKALPGRSPVRECLRGDAVYTGSRLMLPKNSAIWSWASCGFRETSQKTQTWLAVSDYPAAFVSGRYWHHLRQQEPASEAVDPDFQNKLVDKLREMTGVALARS
jgi:hypothetical protein